MLSLAQDLLREQPVQARTRQELRTLLTGFDAPCVHTLYVDKPMKGHNLMQAIARVNRVFRDKQGGLVVDYIGIGNDSPDHQLCRGV